MKGAPPLEIAAALAGLELTHPRPAPRPLLALLPSLPLLPCLPACHRAQVYKAIYDQVQVVAVKVLVGIRNDPHQLESVLQEVRRLGVVVAGW